MTHSEMLDTLYSIQRDHMRTREDSYALHNKFMRYLNSLSIDERKTALTVLRESIENETSEIRWNALGCIVDLADDGSSELIAGLYNKYSSQGNHTEWQDTFIFALMRLRARSYSSTCIKHVRRSLKKKGSRLSALIAHLLFIDTSAFVQIATQFWIGILKEKEPLFNPEGHIGTFLFNAAKDDPQIIRRLIDEVRKKNPLAGDKLNQLCLDYLEKYWNGSNLTRVYTALLRNTGV